MTNFVDKFNNRYRELEHMTRMFTAELTVIPIPVIVYEDRIKNCNNCEYKNHEICNKTGCIISIIIKSPTLTCPIDKWLALTKQDII
jgi:hypothetical protein